jgi:hypothetical protein
MDKKKNSALGISIKVLMGLIFGFVTTILTIVFWEEMKTWF